MNTKTRTEDNRARLLNMAAGGDGHTAPYIERVILDGAAPEQRTAYIYHSPAQALPNGSTAAAAAYLGTFEQCKAFYMLPYLEADDDTRKRAADSMPVEDYGRHIAADVWQPLWETMRTPAQP